MTRDDKYSNRGSLRRKDKGVVGKKIRTEEEEEMGDVDYTLDNLSVDPLDPLNFVCAGRMR